MTISPLRLKKNEHRRLRAGHLWVFSNQVDIAQTPLGNFTAGDLVRVEESNGRALGTGYVNPRSLICARLVSRDPALILNRSLLVHRLNVALALRARLYAAPYYRLVYGEGDGLPGLVVDRYGDALVAQITTAGMERQREQIVDALVKVLSPRTIVFRNDAPVRELEGLDLYVERVLGETPELAEIPEGGAVFRAPVDEGQKTGWYYDQRDNRLRLAPLAKSMRVLDVFSYAGAWGVQAAAAGADKVICVDSSAAALSLATTNSDANGVAERVETQQGDAFEVLAAMRAERERFDVVVLDPPAFIKRKKDYKQGAVAYRRLNQMAMQLLQRDGILVSASCSYHLSRAALEDIVLQSARHLDRSCQVLYQGYQGPDHPVHPAIPETAYLKAIFARVLPA